MVPKQSTSKNEMVLDATYFVLRQMILYINQPALNCVGRARETVGWYKSTLARKCTILFQMDNKQDPKFVPLVEKGNSTASLVAYMQSQQRKRSLRDVTIVVSCFAILAWCGYLTLSVKDGRFFLYMYSSDQAFEGVLDMRMAEMEIKRIEEVVNEVVAAIPAEKNPEVRI